MTLNISHRGLEMTPAIHDYVEEKMLSLEKYFDNIRHMDVEVGLTTHHHQKGDIFFCKVVMQIDGDVERIEKETDDLYKAVDEVKDALRIQLTELKRKLEDRNQGKIA
jgi:putative sigma-54 modulation protein